MKYYMHTLNGLPAFFCKDSRIICYSTHSRGAKNFHILASSLKQIRQEQKEDRVNDLDTYSAFKHDYVLVYLPESEK